MKSHTLKLNYLFEIQKCKYLENKASYLDHILDQKIRLSRIHQWLFFIEKLVANGGNVLKLFICYWCKLILFQIHSLSKVTLRKQHTAPKTIFPKTWNIEKVKLKNTK